MYCPRSQIPHCGKLETLAVNLTQTTGIGENAHKGLCQAPCRVYRGIDVDIGGHLTYVDGELGIRP
jgi:hypothetical protein